MREIKFRAWHKVHKEMFSVFQLARNGLYGLEQRSDINGITTRWAAFEDIDIMQYTGLEDKNGKEIYEGDIVRYTKRHDPHFNKDICSVGEVYWNGFSYRIKGSNYGQSEEKYAIQCEIIGNIYENPELLETT
jgi:uncharacterized phage protein (TIGR01671 family)